MTLSLHMCKCSLADVKMTLFLHKCKLCEFFFFFFLHLYKRSFFFTSVRMMSFCFYICANDILFLHLSTVSSTQYVADNSFIHDIYLGPVVQSIVSLASSLVVKMLTVLVSTISNSQVFLLKKM